MKKCFSGELPGMYQTHLERLLTQVYGICPLTFDSGSLQNTSSSLFPIVAAVH